MSEERVTSNVKSGDIVLSSRIRLARNFDDLPFRPKMSADQADDCIDRTLNALKADPLDFSYFPMRGMKSVEKRVFAEEHRISTELYERDDRGAALMSRDGSVVIMVNEEDHLRIQAFSKGLDLESCFTRAFAAEDALQESLSFAFDDEWGYLTACPTNTGTAMRASVMLHLPMLTQKKNMGQVTQMTAKLGLTMRGIYGEGSEALGNVYQLSNQVTLGKTERELVDAVTAVARQVAGMERLLRQKAAADDPLGFSDRIHRAFGAFLYARLMPMSEFYSLWSSLRIGAAMGSVPVSVSLCDTMLERAQEAHLTKEAGHDLTERETQAARAAMIRGMLAEKDEPIHPIDI